MSDFYSLLLYLSECNENFSLYKLYKSEMEMSWGTRGLSLYI